VNDSGAASAGFREILGAYYRVWFRYHPEAAVDAGVAGHEHRLTPFLPEERAALVFLNDQLVVSLDELNREALDPDESLDYDIVRASALLENQRILDVEPQHLDPEAMLPINAVYQLTIKPVADPVAAILARLAAVPAHLATAQTYLGGRAARTPLLWVESAVATAEEGITQIAELRTHPWFSAAPAALESVLDPAIRAVREFGRFLARDIAPAAGGHYAVGPRYFQSLLRYRHFLDITADELKRFGEELYEQTRRDVLEACRELTGTTDLNAALKIALAGAPPKDQLLQAYRDGMEAARRFLSQRDLVTLPPRQRLDVVETPVFLRHQIPFAAYSEPSVTDEAQQGYYYVTPPAAPEQLAEHGSAGILHTCVHEAWPGHHLQFVTANGNPTSRTLPRLLNPSATLYEGWALYCEQLMYEQGFLDGPAQRFLLLRDRLWRALRIVIDVGLHTGGLTLDQAADRMVQSLGFSRASAIADLTWYTRSPTVPLGYATGWALINGLRDRLRAQAPTLGLKEFHDRLLAAGSVALPLAIKRGFGSELWLEVRHRLFGARVRA
jgi:uncharacterized protein (DUF885 family)